jgi:hypothetical protein
MAFLVINRSSTAVVKLIGLLDTEALAPEDQYPTNATVTASIVDRVSGEPVPGADQLELAYVAGTTGPDTLYLVAVSADVQLPADQYTLVVVVTDASGNKRVFRRRIVVTDGEQ